MTVVVRMDEEHAAALDVAIITLQADLAILEKWGGSSVNLSLILDDLKELRERYRQATGGDVYGDNTKHSLRVIR